MFIHEDAEFGRIIGIVAAATGIDRSLIEKDYWVVHALWALHAGPFDIWFKGGTSLSKGFGLIQRFSEDLDLKVVPLDLSAAPLVNWKADKPQHIESRKEWYRWLSGQIRVAGAEVMLDEQHWQVGSTDSKARGADIQVRYPGQHLAELAGHNLPFVKLELGDARVVPFVTRPVSSFIHEYLEGRNQLTEFTDNRPRSVRHVHPWVTLLEKLDAISKRYAYPLVDAARFIRHYEDAARIAEANLEPPAGYTLATLTAEVVGDRAVPRADDPAFALADPVRLRQLQAAYADLSGMYWGPRHSLEEVCAVLREWCARGFAVG